MGEVRRLWIRGPAGRLEAALRLGREDAPLAVLAHPHPLHGGTLHNPVVFHADRGLNRAGFTTLRFNFRGAGESEGEHDEGVGEVHDVEAAVTWLRGLRPDRPCLLVGYSFGAWCGLRQALADPGIAAMVAIGLPVKKYRFDALRELHRPFAVVQSEHDEFGTPAEIRPFTDLCDPPARVLVVPGTSHLFPGRAPEAGTRVVEAASALLEPGGP